MLYYFIEFLDKSTFYVIQQRKNSAAGIYLLLSLLLCDKSTWELASFDRNPGPARYSRETSDKILPSSAGESNPILYPVRSFMEKVKNIFI